MRLPLPYIQCELVDLTVALLQANETRGDTYIYPLAYPLGANEKRFDPRDLDCELLVTSKPMQMRLGTGRRIAPRLARGRESPTTLCRRGSRAWPAIATASLLRFEVKQDGYDVALLLNTNGKVCEAVSASVFLLRDGRLVTPDLNSDILEGITRDTAITLARERLDIEVVERPVDRTELYIADEVFICGTAVEITPVLSVECQSPTVAPDP